MIITQILTKNAAKYKNKIALVEQDFFSDTKKKIDWEDFCKLSNQFALALVKQGVQKKDKVVILMTNCLEWLLIYFGILYTGAWAVPLNFRFESEKISFCTNIAQAKVFVFGEEFIKRIESIREKSLSFVRLWIFIGPKELCPKWALHYDKFIKTGENLPLLNVDIKDDDDAALYFTSGTTGIPKAVLITHKNLSHACYCEQAHHKQNQDDVFLCIPPLYHTGAKMHWMGSFLKGGRSVLLKGIKPDQILKTISSELCTIVWLLVPWIHDIIIAIENNEIDLSKYRLSQWRLMHAGAQPIPPNLITKWRKYFPNQDYDTNYGLTEATGPGCVHLGTDNIEKIGAIGLPGFQWEARVVDEKGRHLFGSETGELIVKGPGVMREYYKNPEETLKTLKDGWLYTGDIARYDKDGFIWLVDRKKDMIVYGGENIYPVEIENFFQENENIKDIAVIGVPDDRLGEVPAGIISVKEGCDLSEKDIILFQQKLPKYKQLKKIFFADVPRNPTGKIEKPKLRRIYAKDKRITLDKLLK